MRSFELVDVLGHSSATPQCSAWLSLSRKTGEVATSLQATLAYEYIVISEPGQCTETMGVQFCSQAVVYTAQSVTMLDECVALLHAVDEECGVHTYRIGFQDNKFFTSYVDSCLFACVVDDNILPSAEPTGFPLVHKVGVISCHTDVSVAAPCATLHQASGRLGKQECLFMITDTCSLLFTVSEGSCTLTHVFPFILTHAQFCQDRLFVCNPSHLWMIEVPTTSVSALITGKGHTNSQREFHIHLRYTHANLNKGAKASPLLGVFCNPSRTTLLLADGVLMAQKKEGDLLSDKGKLVADSWVQTKVGLVPQAALTGDGTGVCVYSADFDRCRLFSVDSLSHLFSFASGKYEDLYVSVNHSGTQFALITNQGQQSQFRSLGGNAAPRLIETRPSSTSIAWSVCPFDPLLQQCPLNLVLVVREDGVLTLLHRDSAKNAAHCLQSTRQTTKLRCAAVARNHHHDQTVNTSFYYFVVFVGSNDGDILIYDLQIEKVAPYASTFTLKHTVQAHEGAVRCIAWNEDQHQFLQSTPSCNCTSTSVCSCQTLHGSLATCGDDSFVHVLSSKAITGPPAHSFSHHTGPVTSLHFLNGNTLCSTSTRSPSVAVVTLDAQNLELYTFATHPVISACLHPSKRFLCLSYSNGYLSIVSSSALTKHTEGISYLKKYAVQLDDDSGSPLVLQPSLDIDQYASADSGLGIALSVDVHPSGQLIAVGVTNGSVRLYDWVTGVQYMHHQYSSAPASVSFSTDGRQLYIGLAEGTVHILTLPDHQLNLPMRNAIKRKTYELQLSKMSTSELAQFQWQLDLYEYSTISPSNSNNNSALDNLLEIVPTPVNSNNTPISVTSAEPLMKSKWKTPVLPDMLVQREGTRRNTTQRLNATQRLLEEQIKQPDDNDQQTTGNGSTLRRGFTGMCKHADNQNNLSTRNDEHDLMVTGSMFSTGVLHIDVEEEDNSTAVDIMDDLLNSAIDAVDDAAVVNTSESEEIEYVLDFEEDEVEDTESDDVDIDGNDHNSLVSPIKHVSCRAQSVQVGFFRQESVAVLQENKMHVDYPTLQKPINHQNCAAPEPPQSNVEDSASSILPPLPSTTLILDQEPNNKYMVVINHEDDDEDDLQIHFTPTHERRHTEDHALVNRFGHGQGGTIQYGSVPAALGSLVAAAPVTSTVVDPVRSRPLSLSSNSQRSFVDVNELILEHTGEFNDSISSLVSSAQHNQQSNNLYDLNMAASIKQTDDQGVVRHIFSPTKLVTDGLGSPVDADISFDFSELIEVEEMGDVERDGYSQSNIDVAAINFHMTSDTIISTPHSKVDIPILNLPVQPTTSSTDTLTSLLDSVRTLTMEGADDATIDLTMQLLQATTALAVSALHTARTQRMNATQRSTNTVSSVVTTLQQELPAPKLLLSDGNALDIDVLAAKIAAQVRNNM